MAPSHCLSVGQDSHNAAQSTHSHSLQTGRQHRACVRATRTRHPSQQEHTFSCHVSRMPHEFSVGSAKPRYMYLTSTSSSSLDSVSTAFCTSAALNRVSTSRTREKLLACSKQYHAQSGEGHCYRASCPSCANLGSSHATLQHHMVGCRLGTQISTQPSPIAHYATTITLTLTLFP